MIALKKKERIWKEHRKTTYFADKGYHPLFSVQGQKKDTKVSDNTTSIQTDK